MTTIGKRTAVVILVVAVAFVCGWTATGFWSAVGISVALGIAAVIAVNSEDGHRAGCRARARRR